MVSEAYCRSSVACPSREQIAARSSPRNWAEVEIERDPDARIGGGVAVGDGGQPEPSHRARRLSRQCQFEELAAFASIAHPHCSSEERGHLRQHLTQLVRLRISAVVGSWYGHRRLTIEAGFGPALPQTSRSVHVRISSRPGRWPHTACAYRKSGFHKSEREQEWLGCMTTGTTR